MAQSPLYDTFARAPLAIARGEGAWVETTDGRRLLDFSGGVAVNALGHAHPALIKALTEQAAKVWHVSNLFRAPEQEALAAKLCALSFADKVFFGNSGAEASECAIKTARRYHFVSGHPERFRIVTFAGAFHGRTIATLAATGNPKYLEGFGPVPDGFDQVPLGDLEAVKAVDRSGHRRDHDRADPGRGGPARGARTVPARAARALRPARPAPHFRRGADRRRAHRPHVRA